jgi:hypothetical protein
MVLASRLRCHTMASALARWRDDVDEINQDHEWLN